MAISLNLFHQKSTSSRICNINQFNLTSLRSTSPICSLLHRPHPMSMPKNTQYASPARPPNHTPVNTRSAWRCGRRVKGHAPRRQRVGEVKVTRPPDARAPASLLSRRRSLASSAQARGQAGVNAMAFTRRGYWRIC